MARRYEEVLQDQVADLTFRCARQVSQLEMAIETNQKLAADYSELKTKYDNLINLTITGSGSESYNSNNQFEAVTSENIEAVSGLNKQ